MQRQPIDKYDGPKCVGIDVSHHNGPISWPGVKTDFVFVRTGDGKDVDKRVEENLQGATDHVEKVGTYRYLRADRDGEAQAELDLEILAKNAITLSLPIAADAEEGIRKNLPGGIYSDSLGEIPPEVVAEELLQYLQVIERETGTRPILYTGQFFHWIFSQARPNLASLFASYALWVPSYNVQYPRMPVDPGGLGFPWDHWTFHQYTSKGAIKGIKGDVDLNYFRGDKAGLRAFASSRKLEGCAPSVVIEELEKLAACFTGCDDKTKASILAAAESAREYEARVKASADRARRHRRENG